MIEEKLHINVTPSHDPRDATCIPVFAVLVEPNSRCVFLHFLCYALEVRKYKVRDVQTTRQKGPDVGDRFVTVQVLDTKSVDFQSQAR